MNIPNIKKLHIDNKLKEKQEEKYYRIVLDNCIDKLTQIHNSLKQTFFVFNVPNILLNFPGYKKEICLYFLYNNFKKKKYNVEILNDTQLSIDWSKRYKKKEISKTFSQKDQEKFLKDLFPKAKFEIIYQ
jgi:hypothetical protein